MKQVQIIKAMQALNNLAAQALPIKSACAIHRLRVQLRPAWDFQQEEEDKLLGKLKPTIDPDGNLDFKTPEDAQKYRELLKELGAMDAEGNTLPEGFTIQPVTLPLRAMDGIQITANEVEALEGFVTFMEE